MTLPSSRSSSSPTRRPAPRSTVSPTSERIIQPRERIHHCNIDVGRQGPRKQLIEFGDVDGENQTARWGLLPTPFGDVVEQVAHAQHRRLDHGLRDDASGAGSGALPTPGAGAVPDEETLDVIAVEILEGRDLGMSGGEVVRERQ